MGQVTRLMGSSVSELKTEVNTSIAPDIIYFNGRVYEIYYDELRNLGLDNRDEIEDLARNYGLMQPSLFERNCFLCENHTENISTLLRSGKIKKGEWAEVTEIPGRQPDCRYDSPFDIMVAKTAQNNHKKSQIFYAIAPNCVFYDVLVYHLATHGLLDQYRTDREFNFRPLSDFEQGSTNPEDFAIKRRDGISLVRLVRKLLPPSR